MKSLNKRGVELSLNTIIIVILALIVLIVIALFFSGGLTKLFGEQSTVAKLQIDPQIKSLVIATCELKCAQGDVEWYNNPQWDDNTKQALEAAGKPSASCSDLLNKGCT